MDGQDSTRPWIDRAEVSVLAYAVALNEIDVVREILKCYNSRKSHLLAWRFPKEGVVDVGIPGHSTCLYGAMCFASPDIVAVLLDAGANVGLRTVLHLLIVVRKCWVPLMFRLIVFFPQLRLRGRVLTCFL